MTSESHDGGGPPGKYKNLNRHVSMLTFGNDILCAVSELQFRNLISKRMDGMNESINSH